MEGPPNFPKPKMNAWSLLARGSIPRFTQISWSSVVLDSFILHLVGDEQEAIKQALIAKKYCKAIEDTKNNPSKTDPLIHEDSWKLLFFSTGTAEEIDFCGWIFQLCLDFARQTNMFFFAFEVPWKWPPRRFCKLHFRDAILGID